MDKDEMKNKISLALKDPILQQGFEIICKNLADLEKENAELRAQIKSDEDLPAIAYQQGAERQKKKDEEQLTKAKELLAKWVELFKPKGGNIPPTPIQVDTEQFLKENE